LYLNKKSNLKRKIYADKQTLEYTEKANHVNSTSRTDHPNKKYHMAYGMVLSKSIGMLE